VRNFSYVTYYDGWDGAHPRVFSPRYKPYIEFESGEAINNWLLLNAEVRAHMTRNVPHGERVKVAMVFFDEETERICRELGYDLILPSAALRNQLDSKIETTKLGNEAGAFSVPNVLTTADTYEELNERAAEEGTGHGSRRADSVRRFGEDDVLHLPTRLIGRRIRTTSSASSSR
jgi:hypothetical protein